MKPPEWVFCRGTLPPLASVMVTAAERERARITDADSLVIPSTAERQRSLLLPVGGG